MEEKQECKYCGATKEVARFYFGDEVLLICARCLKLESRGWK